jgi:dTDP-4-amino-4,6-dideoxygalactose transaminase
MVGWNSRMDGFQGAILSVKLKYLHAWNEARRENAMLYGKLLQNLDGVTIPVEFPQNRHVYHLYVVRVPDRDFLVGALSNRDIHCGIHYPIPLHLQEAYSSLGLEKGSFPVAEKTSSEFMSLPMYPELTREQIDRVAGEIQKLISKQLV